MTTEYPEAERAAIRRITTIHGGYQTQGTASVGQAGGLKFDAGKDQWYLLLSGKGMIRALKGVVKILMFGARKYKAHSWREVEDNERRYLDGLMRHYAAIMEDGLQARDEESGELHIDHLNCNGLFLGELAREKPRKEPHVQQG